MTAVQLDAGNPKKGQAWGRITNVRKLFINMFYKIIMHTCDLLDSLCNVFCLTVDHMLSPAHNAMTLTASIQLWYSNCAKHCVAVIKTMLHD